MSDKKQKSTAHGKAKPRAKAAAKVRPVVVSAPSVLSESAEAKTGELRRAAKAMVYGYARGGGIALQENCADYIRSHPVKAVVLAACAGFLLGIAVRK